MTPGETLEVPLKIETMPEEVKVLGNFSPRGVLSAVDAGYYVVAVLDVGLEPTNHLLNDLSAARTALEAWGRPIYLIATSEAQLERLHNEIDGGRFGTLPATVVFGIDTDGSILSGLAEGLASASSTPTAAPSTPPRATPSAPARRSPPLRGSSDRATNELFPLFSAGPVGGRLFFIIFAK